MEGDSRDSGIKAVGEVKWGAHLCQFYKDKAALVDLLCDYFIAGLESGEFCMWVTPAHTTVEEAKAAMRSHLPGFDEYLEKGQMMVVSYLDWYKKGGSFDLKRVLDGWLEIYNREIEGKGYAGMRVSGDTSWLCAEEWQGFDEYERVLQGAVGGYRLLVLCTYSLGHIGAKELLDVVSNHDFVLIERGEGWEFAESPGKRRLREGLEAAKEEIELKYRDRTRELFEANLRLTSEIDERAGAEESLKESLELLEGIMDNSSAFIFIRDLEGRYLMVNKRMELIGKNIIGLTPYDLYPKVMAEEFLKHDRAVIEAGEPLEFEEEVVIEGKKRVGLTNKFPIFGRDGKIRAVCGIATDITERKAMEESLKRSEAGLADAQRLARLIAWEWDPKTEEASFSEGIYDIIGTTREKGEIKTLMGFVYPGDLEGVLSVFNAALGGKGLFVAEYRIVRPDGAIRVIRSEGKVGFEEGTGRPLKVSGFLQDVTEWKKLQEESEGIREKHLNAQRTELIGKLAGGIAHEFNNIMSSIKLNSELALSEPDERAKREFLEDIRSASGQAENLTRQLLIFSSNEPARFALHDLNGAVQEAVSMLRSLLPENIEIKTDLEDGTWPVFADRLHIEQIILNLALNARDAMPDGGRLTIKTRNTVVTSDNGDGLAAGRYLGLSISDTGTGMNAGVMKRAFEPFFTTKGGKGMGLGLAVVKRIVGEHKGEIRASSEPFKGASFEVFLPAMNSPAAQPRETASLGNGERILIVEDEERLRKVVALVLRKSGYRVMEARSADEALGVFRREGGKVDLVFTDVILEDKSGIELADELSRRGSASKVLFTSGYMDIKDGWPEPDGGNLKLLRKPYEVTELLAAVKELLRV